MAIAIWNGAVLAEGDDVVMVEGNCYFSTDHIRWEHFKPAAHTTFCAWKGTASYHDVVVDGRVNPGAAWYYAEPMPAAEAVRDRVAFWKGVEVDAGAHPQQGPEPPPREVCEV